MNLRRLLAVALTVACLGSLVGCVRQEGGGKAARSCPYRRPARR